MQSGKAEANERKWYKIDHKTFFFSISFIIWSHHGVTIYVLSIMYLCAYGIKNYLLTLIYLCAYVLCTT